MKCPLLLLFCLPLLAQVRITPGAEKISVEIDGKPFTDFYVAGAEVTKPFLFPLRAPSGTYVTRMWPTSVVVEEKSIKKDHQHQRGLWFAHDKVNKLDFWNNEASYKTGNRGRIVLSKLGEIKSGPTQGSLAAMFDWVSMAGGDPLLTESRLMTFTANKDARLVDLDITLTARLTVTLGDGKDGLLGIRMRPILQEENGTGRITNADGLVGEKQLWGKPSHWCDYSGEVNGEKVGIAILDHPENPRHPVRWHARGYGLFAANPFGLAVFTKDKSQNGAMKLEPGQTLRFRFRVIIHSGDAQSADIAGAWKQYSAPGPIQ